MLQMLSNLWVYEWIQKKKTRQTSEMSRPVLLGNTVHPDTGKTRARHGVH